METQFETYDFGEVTQGDKKEIAYQRKNIALQIARIETSCGCTSATWTDDGRTINVTFHSSSEWPEGVSGNTYTTSKFMTLFFKNGTSHSILLKGTIKRK